MLDCGAVDRGVWSRAIESCWSWVPSSHARSGLEPHLQDALCDAIELDVAVKLGYELDVSQAGGLVGLSTSRGGCAPRWSMNRVFLIECGADGVWS